MAGTYLRRPLSGSTNGRGIKVVQTGTAGTTIHTAQSGTGVVDIVTLYATNTHTVTVRLTLEWGGATVPDDNMIFDLPPKTTTPIVMDCILRNSLVIAAFADTANLVAIHGFVTVET